MGEYFIKGRSIPDAIFIRHEIINQVKKEKKRGFLLKLDFEKAYDRLLCDWLMEIIKARNFGPKRTTWIEKWLTSSKTNILHNGMEGK